MNMKKISDHLQGGGMRTLEPFAGLLRVSQSCEFQFSVIKSLLVHVNEHPLLSML